MLLLKSQMSFSHCPHHPSGLLSNWNATSSMKPSLSSIPSELTMPFFECCSVFPMILKFLVGRDGVYLSFSPSTQCLPLSSIVLTWKGLVGGRAEWVNELSPFRHHASWSIDPIRASPWLAVHVLCHGKNVTFKIRRCGLQFAIWVTLG